MAEVDVDVIESALRDVNLSSSRETVLKPEQESAVRAPNVCTREELRAKW